MPLNDVINGIYDDCSKVKRSGHRGSRNPEEAVEIIANDLLKGVLRNYLEGLGIHHLQSSNQISWTLITEIFSSGQKSGKESMKLLITEM